MAISFLQPLFKALQLFLRNKALIRIPIQRLLRFWTYVTKSLASLRSSIAPRGREAISVDPAAEKNHPESMGICASELPSDSVSDPLSESWVNASATHLTSDKSSGTNFDPQSPPHSDSPYATANEDGSCSSTEASLAASVSRISITIPRAVSCVNQNDAASVSQISIIAPGMTAGPTPLVDSLSQGCNLTGEVTISPIQEESENVTLGGDTVDLTGQWLSAICEDFYPFLPESVGRYKRSGTVSKQETEYELLPMTKLYTDANIYDDKILSYITNLIGQFDQYLHAHNIRLSSHVNVVFEISGDSDEMWCQYYLADHATRSVFWLDKFVLSKVSSYLWSEVPGVTKPSHVREFRVCIVPVDPSIWFFRQDMQSKLNIELRDILIYSIGDVITSSTTTVPYEATELQQMLEMVNNIQNNMHGSKVVQPYSRLMHNFTRLRFKNFHGQLAARLDWDQSVYIPPGSKTPRSLLLRILSPPLFFAPETYCRELDKIWIDGQIHAARWTKYFSEMHTEWQQQILLDTVLLSGNVAFLAIQSVDEDTANPGRSPAQITSYLSVMASIGSILIGLMLTRKNKLRARELALNAVLFSKDIFLWSKQRVGLETLAILYSVPFALLIVVLFLVGFSFMCLRHSAITVPLLICITWAIIALLLIWCMFTLASWDEPFSAGYITWDRLASGVEDTAGLVIAFVEKISKALRGASWRGVTGQFRRGENRQEADMSSDAIHSNTRDVIALQASV
ncbi:hypothetical protein VNI00_015389 [Paramarasmius palmivorus]|uniref:Uncharacterized protein n=1 Tax=Paramarasmius palmivorus TaxID=297713 RepID=A0AAW0BIT3_9AGAR